ncbi:MAG: thioredoxin fold domain-containing protein [Cocleimonas sp.]
MPYLIKLHFPRFASLLLILISLTTFAEAKEMGKVTGTADVVIPSYFKDSFLDFREDAADAADSDKHMLVFAHLKGCPYCDKMLKDNFVNFEKEGGNRDLIEKNFDSIHLNIKGSRDVAFDENTDVTEVELAQALQIKYTPTLLFMNAKNKVVTRINGYRSPREFKQVLNYIKDKAYEKTDFPSYRLSHLTDSVYTLLDHESFIKTADLSQFTKSKKPLAVLFEDKTCDECDRFHTEILDLAETKVLMKQFNVVRLDVLSNKKIIGPQGDTTTAQELLKEAGISYRPAMLVFVDGKEKERLTGLLKSFHFQQLLSFFIKKKYKEYPNFIAYGDEYSKKILESGKDIDIWK